MASSQLCLCVPCCLQEVLRLLDQKVHIKLNAIEYILKSIEPSLAFLEVRHAMHLQAADIDCTDAPNLLRRTAKYKAVEYIHN